jgi:hypothetical protein
MKTALCMVLLAGTAVADDKPAGPITIPKPPAELDAVKDWLKGWNCNGSNGLGEKITAKMTMKKELDGHWFSVTFDAAKTKMLPAFAGRAWFGIDPISKGWVLKGFDSYGGWIDLKSKDASATAMTWEGEGVDMGKKLPVKFTMTLPDKKKLGFIGEFAGKKRTSASSPQARARLQVD